MQCARTQSTNSVTLIKLFDCWLNCCDFVVAYFRTKLRPFRCLQIWVDSLCVRWSVVAWMPKCEVRLALTPELTLPQLWDRSLTRMRPSLSKFGELPPLTSSMLPKSRDRPVSMQGRHIVTDRGHLSLLIPVRRSLPKPRVRLPSTPIQGFLLTLVVTCLTMTTSDAGKFYARALRVYLLW